MFTFHNIAQVYSLHVAWYLQVKYAKPDVPTIIHCKSVYTNCFDTHCTDPLEDESKVIITITPNNMLLQHFPYLDKEIGKHFKIILLSKNVNVKQDYHLVCKIGKASTVDDNPYILHLDSFSFSLVNSLAFIDFSTLNEHEITHTIKANTTSINSINHTPILIKTSTLIRTIICHPDIPIPRYLKFYGSNPYAGIDPSYYYLDHNWSAKASVPIQ